MTITATPTRHMDDGNPERAMRHPLDYFLHASLYEDSDTLRRARILVAGICAIIPISCLAALVMIFAPIPATARAVGIPADILLIGILAALLFKLKHDGNYDFCCNLTVSLILICLSYGIFVTGGVTTSPIAQLLAGPPLIAFFLGGIRTGRSMTVVTCVIVAGALLVEHNGVAFPQLLELKHVGIAQALVLSIGFLANTALAFVYENTSAALRNERDAEHRKIIQLAHTDALTGLANRRIFDQTLAERVARHRDGTNRHPFALCYLDLNGFKPINDRHGHDVGDEVLRAVSIRLRSSLRGVDMIGRPGGDEFMLLLDKLEPGPQLEILANRFLKIIADPIETSAGLLCIGGSFGFAFYPQHGVDAESLAKAADSAMYEAKRNKLGWCVIGAKPSPDSVYS